MKFSPSLLSRGTSSEVGGGSSCGVQAVFYMPPSRTFAPIVSTSRVVRNPRGILTCRTKRISNSLVFNDRVGKILCCEEVSAVFRKEW